MTDKIVFDSAALIMLFAKEPGYESVKQNLKQAIISTVNIAEIYKYCLEVQNLTEDDCKNLLNLSGIKIIDFCEKQALISATIIKQTKQHALSLGDRSCIALAMYKNYPLFTCNKLWPKINLGVKFIMAR